MQRDNMYAKVIAEGLNHTNTTLICRPTFGGERNDTADDKVLYMFAYFVNNCLAWANVLGSVNHPSKSVGDIKMQRDNMYAKVIAEGLNHTNTTLICRPTFGGERNDTADDKVLYMFAYFVNNCLAWANVLGSVNHPSKSVGDIKMQRDNMYAKVIAEGLNHTNTTLICRPTFGGERNDTADDKVLLSF
ncbi:hypothetical protein DYB31_010235 [Aphanomyces astaci]|uniref:Uncharacterized protein n=1 Tax=Aphanomyces astaci TaxID=112090 RepID=A0A397FB84_APHAT|nr:hypothetical protein DYB31_010235 [Aphanomyces astaci]